MGIRHDTKDSLRDFTFMLIEGQPTDDDINNLVKECSKAAASVPTANKGGRHRHIGMQMEDTEYQLILHKHAPFIVPVYPGPYPKTVDENNAAISPQSSSLTIFDPWESDVTVLTKELQKDWGMATGVINPNWHILGNKAHEELKQAIRENECQVKLTPADMHRRNVAEQAKQTFKGHFISVLVGVADNFLIYQWDELLPQTILTLNLLRQSNVAPNISAYAYHHGSFNYNRMPLAPMGFAVQFHIKPSRQKSFGEHSSNGWHLMSSPEHYR
ncbi:hypothetical protein ACHAW6_004234 [Cyclotella cf. meneghiniana]